jgi:Na+/H+-dicarboxylate symporter
MNDAAASHLPGNFYTRIPLYLRIIAGLILGVILGMVLMHMTPDRTNPPKWVINTMTTMNEAAKLLLRMLNMIAPPLILVAVVRALITAEIKGRQAGRLMFLLILNTLVAIIIGLVVANILRPGKHAQLEPGKITETHANPLLQFLENIPKSFIGPFGDEANTIGVIIIAVGVGLVVRKLDQPRKETVVYATTLVFDIIIGLLHWVIQLVPIAVMAKVAYIIAKDGFAPFKAVAWFIVAVLLALFIQSLYYLARVRIGSWVRPMQLIRGTRDALVLAFSTASSTAAMPVTYECLKDRVGIRPQSASLGALVGANFNNDGTALYEAMSALFIAQMIGQDLSLVQQFMVVITSVVAAVGAAGIPEAGLVTMTMVFNAVHLPVGYIALLLPVDWFLDRCRTAINVMGDMNVSCLLDGKTPPPTAERVVAGFPISTQ